MKRIFKTYATIAIFLFCAVTMPLTASAIMGGISADPVFPGNQDPQTKSYFDLIMEPSQKQKISVTVRNMSREEITVSVETVTATTNRNGIINYTSSGTPDKTMKYQFADLATAPKKHITIPPGRGKNVSIALEMPDEKLDGIILGSIRVTKELSEKDKRNSGAIVNRYSYVVAVRLKESNAVIHPKFLLGGVSEEQVNYKTSIVANIRNPKPKLMKGATVSAKIYRKGGSSAIVETSKKVDFAPNSIFPFLLADVKKQGITPGRYIAKLAVKYEGEKWSFEEEFEVK